MEFQRTRIKTKYGVALSSMRIANNSTTKPGAI